MPWELFWSERFAIPALQVFLLMLLNSVCLLLGRFKQGLLLSYCFAFYWGFVFSRDQLMAAGAMSTGALTVYLISGMAMLAVAMVGFFREP